MQAIYKVVLDITDEQVVSIDNLYQVVSCQMQGDKLCVWYVVDNHDGIKQDLNFQIIGTGNPCKLEVGSIYLATVQQNHFVWHVFYNFAITPK